jgi:hypothetical protein
MKQRVENKENLLPAKAEINSYAEKYRNCLLM